MFAVLRKIAILTTVSATWMMAHSLLGYADELDSLQRERETAQMQYVNELGSGKYKSAAERDALKKKYLAPSDQKTKEYFASISTMPSARPVKPEEIDLRNGPKTSLSTAQGAELGNDQVTGHVTSQPTQSKGGIPPQEKSPLRPEYVLDGSNVPKEITFGVPSFENPKAATPSPTPSSTAKIK